MYKFLLITLIILAQSCATSKSEVEPKEKPKTEITTTREAPTQVFAWPFLEPETMKSQGGMTMGAPATLDHNDSTYQKLQEMGISKFERDRRAILAMAGDYRVSFQFIETMGYTKKFHPSRPYFSWGTESIRVIKDTTKEISLQHTLCMWFRTKDGKLEGPMVMKHWRQDWKYEDKVLWDYRAGNKWIKTENKDFAGNWSQKVFQVDDSPRYFTSGKWQHQNGVSSWRSEIHRRPLPRREFAVRSDYNILEGYHDITITPNGWVHVQNNDKVNRDGKNYKTLSRETGINRYERIAEPSLTQADEYWQRTNAYWAEVRAAWNDILKNSTEITLKNKYKGKKLFMYHFSYAGKIKDGEYKAAEGRKHARETVENFLGTPEKPNY